MDKKEKLSVLAGNNPNFTDECLTFQLESAENMILNFCNIDSMPERLENVQLQLALKLLNRMGAEGSTSYSEGGQTQSFDDVLTPDILKQLYPFRKVVF